VRVVAGDIGGTKTLLRLIDFTSTLATVVAEQRFESNRFSTFDAILGAFLEDAPRDIDAACFAVAGPVLDERAEVTNLSWTMESSAIASAFNIRRVSLINDFYAVALGVPLLGADDLLSINAGKRVRGGPIGILGAGTGLGQAMVTFSSGAWHVLPSEGGHADFGPQDEVQTQLCLSLLARYGHVSWERVLSGMGLVNIFTFLGGDRSADGAEIARLEAAGDPIATQTFEIFVDVYGAEAGNMALRVLARGGVFLAGGIAAKHIARFTDGRFMQAFLRKGRFTDLLAEMPVDLITNEKVGLIGAAENARRLAESP
jgi:glucokinase